MVSSMQSYSILRNIIVCDISCICCNATNHSNNKQIMIVSLIYRVFG